MNVRPFDWRDLPALNRNLHESVFLDSTLLLTRGPLLVPGALLSYLAPGMGVFTSVVENESNPGPVSNTAALIGQIIHTLGSPFARLTFMTPVAALHQTTVSALAETLVMIAGERGAMRLLADVDEELLAFEALHQSGFAIYARQCAWRVKNFPPSQSLPSAWRAAHSQDAIAIRSLYNNLVPGMVQQIEPLVAQRPRGMVYYQQGELRAYVEIHSGHRGIWAQPFIHPDAKDAPQLLAALLHKLPNRSSRPVYICVRSYQSWLEIAIEELGAEAGPRQAVMVKHLTIPQKAARALTLPALEGGQTEASAPFARMENQSTPYGTNENHR
jgi:hypothetical protein